MAAAEQQAVHQAEAEQVQEEANELLAKALEVLRSNCQSPGMRPGQADFHTVAAVMAPIATQLARANSIIRRLEQASAYAESFHAVIAATLVKQSQRIHDLEQLQPASVIPVAPSSPASLPPLVAQRQPARPVLSSQLEQPPHEGSAHQQPPHEAKQQMVALKQTQQEQMNNMPAASRSRGLQASYAAAVPSSSISEAMGELPYGLGTSAHAIFAATVRLLHCSRCMVTLQAITGRLLQLG